MNLYLIVIMVLLTCSTTFGSERLIIDSFEYLQSSTAQSLWKPRAESLPVGIITHRTDQDEQALLLLCDFSRKEERCYWDREIDLDLTRFGQTHQMRQS